MLISLDPMTNLTKPLAGVTKIISNNIHNHVIDISLGEFVQALEKGQTWSSLFLGKRTQSNWVKQQVFAADLDKGSYTLEEILSIASLANVSPCIIHKTFSYTEEQPKWRVVFKTDKPVECETHAQDFLRYLTKAFKGDPAVVDTSRLYFGCCKGDVVYVADVNTYPYRLEKEIKTVTPNPNNLSKSQQRCLLIGTISFSKESLLNPENSRYMAIWNSGRRLGQLHILSVDSIVGLVVKLTKDLANYQDYDKDIADIARQGAVWGMENDG